MTDDEIREDAIAYAKKKKDRIAGELTDTSIYPPEAMPMSVFMAGSPGAGKTELSKSLIEILERRSDTRHRVVRIDGDEIRRHFENYTGTNSYLFQGAISIVVDRIQDYVLKQKQTFVLDGTLFDYEKAAKNIRRSLAKNRTVIILYVYQEPAVAWKFTQAREKTEGRNIPKSAFVQGFLGARETVTRLRREFGNEVAITLIQRNFENDTADTESISIEPTGKQIDDYLPRRYTQDELEHIL